MCLITNGDKCYDVRKEIHIEQITHNLGGSGSKEEIDRSQETWFELQFWLLQAERH